MGTVHCKSLARHTGSVYMETRQLFQEAESGSPNRNLRGPSGPKIYRPTRKWRYPENHEQRFGRASTQREISSNHFFV